MIRFPWPKSDARTRARCILLFSQIMLSQNVYRIYWYTSKLKPREAKRGERWSQSRCFSIPRSIHRLLLLTGILDNHQEVKSKFSMLWENKTLLRYDPLSCCVFSFTQLEQSFDVRYKKPKLSVGRYSVLSHHGTSYTTGTLEELDFVHPPIRGGLL